MGENNSLQFLWQFPYYEHNIAKNYNSYNQ